MDFDESKNSLKEAYIALGLKLVDEHPNELFFEKNNMKYIITEEDIEEYKNSQNFIYDNKIIAVYGGICGLNYCELIIESSSQERDILFSRIHRTIEKGIVFGDATSDKVYAEIGLASKHFINFFRFENRDPEIQTRIQIRARFYHPIDNKNGFRDLRDSFRPPTVIRIFNIPETTVENALKFSISLAESCLFEVTYLKNLPYKLLDESSTNVAIRIKQFQNVEKSKENNLDLPKVRFNPDILKFYQLGCSSNIPILQFLAFYQVLEYFFVSVSEEGLYKKILQRLNDPGFKTDERNLGKLIKDVEDFNKINDETGMLKQVITKYVNEDDLIEFIQSYENFLKERIYSKSHSRFGIEQIVKIEKGHVIGNCAAVIKTVRNALVHSSDRHEKNERFVPFSKSTEIVIKEIPLVKFLAEKVIIGSAHEK